jgi:hypothetical protein
MQRQSKSDDPHPYQEFERTGLWKALDAGIRDLVKNGDLKETAPREYIVGYLCKVISRRRNTLFPS